MPVLNLKFYGFGSLPINVHYEGKFANYQNKNQLNSYLTNALIYILQVPFGRAIMSEVKKGDANGSILNLTFTNNDTFNAQQRMVKWNPFMIGWFADTTMSRIYRTKAYEPDMKDPVRPKDVVYSDGNHAVVAIATPATLLLHEFGHAVQLIRKPQMFTAQAHQAELGNKKLIAGTDIEIEDLDWPTEVDNVSWQEQPFIRQLWDMGLTEGIRWHYQHITGQEEVDDWKLERIQARGSTVQAIRLKKNGNWFTPAFWAVKDIMGNKLKQTYLKKTKLLARSINRNFPFYATPGNIKNELGMSKIIRKAN